MIRGALLLLFAAGAAQAAQTVSLRYAGDRDDALWQLRVEGSQVIAQDEAGLTRWSISPSDGTAVDCDGVTQLALLAEDGNGDGRIDALHGERARLVVSSSWRNGAGWDSVVLALDVSRAAAPRRLWRHDSASLPSLSRLVAAPAVAAVDVPRSAPRMANTDTGHFTVLIGAGLPTPTTSTHKARSGAELLLLDAEDGHELWRAAASGTPTQRFAAMTAGLSGSVTALDLNQDGKADRLYIGDAVATLWRFDIAARPATASALMTGGPIARLASPADPTARSIIAAPDVALMAPPVSAGTPPTAWLNIAVGTTYAGTGTSPLRQGLFVLRDSHPFDSLSQAQYDALPVATATNLLGGYSLDTGTDGIVGRALTAAGVLLYTQVEGDALSACRSPGKLLVKATPVVADSGAALDTPDDSSTTGHRLARRTLLRPDGSAASPFDEPTPLLDDIPALHRLSRRYWRREDAD